MPDMLVPLYDLPGSRALEDQVKAAGVTCRRVETYERLKVLEFVRRQWPNWLDEAAAAFSHAPPAMHIAVHAGKIIGFALYNAARPGYFGPQAVLEPHRKKGVGSLLMVRCLNSLTEQGYAYAVIGGVNGTEAFYEKAVGAMVIPGSETGIYGNNVNVSTAD